MSEIDDLRTVRDALQKAMQMAWTAHDFIHYTQLKWRVWSVDRVIREKEAGISS